MRAKSLPESLFWLRHVYPGWKYEKIIGVRRVIIIEYIFGVRSYWSIEFHYFRFIILCVNIWMFDYYKKIILWWFVPLYRMCIDAVKRNLGQYSLRNSKSITIYFWHTNTANLIYIRWYGVSMSTYNRWWPWTFPK